MLVYHSGCRWWILQGSWHVHPLYYSISHGWIHPCISPNQSSCGSWSFHRRQESCRRAWMGRMGQGWAGIPTAEELHCWCLCAFGCFRSQFTWGMHISFNINIIWHCTHLMKRGLSFRMIEWAKNISVSDNKRISTFVNIWMSTVLGTNLAWLYSVRSDDAYQTICCVQLKAP